MSICWYCYWGWSAAVADIYDRFEPIAGEWAMDYGPAHIVWADENFERHHVQWCLDNFEDWCANWNTQRDDPFTPEQLAAVRGSLEALLALSDAELNPEPEDYDGEHPEQFPPAVPMRQP